MLISYRAGRRLHGHDMDELPSRISATRPIKFADVTGTGKAQVTFDRVPLERRRATTPPRTPTSRCACTRSSRGWRASAWSTVYETIERPLIPVLADMEQAGIKVDRDRAASARADFDEAHGRARAARSTSSPAASSTSARPSSWARCCSTSMKLPGGRRRTRPAPESTDADVLEELAAQGHAAAGQGPGLAPARQAQEHLYRRAVARDRSPGPAASTPPIAHGRRRDRAALLDRSQPAEHPDPHRGRPQDPPGLRRRAGPQAARRSTTRRSSCACSPTSPTSRR